MRTQHARRYRRKIERRNAVIAGLAVASITGTVLPAWAARAASPELASWCDLRTIQPGDTVSGIVGPWGVTLDEARQLNPQIPNLDLVYPGDELVVRCVIGAPADQVVDTPMQAMHTDRSLVDVSRWIGQTEQCRHEGRDELCATWQAIIAGLYVRGVVGNDLVTLAAIPHSESARIINRVGDTNIVDKTYGPSLGIYQIRSVHADEGTGRPRDIKRLLDPDPIAALEFNLDSAVSLYESAKVKRSEGKIHPVTKQVWTPFDDWSVHHKGWHLGQVDLVRGIATDMGVL